MLFSLPQRAEKGSGGIVLMRYAVSIFCIFPTHANVGVLMVLNSYEWVVGIVPAIFLLVVLFRAWRKLSVLRAKHQVIVLESDALRRENEFLKQAVLSSSNSGNVEALPVEEKQEPDARQAFPAKKEKVLITEEKLEDGQSSKGQLLPGRISHIWVEGNYIYYKVQDNPKYILRRDTLKNVFAKLEKEHFVRTHKSYLINLAMVRQVTWKEIGLKDGSKVPLSRGYKESFRKAYQDYKGGGD